MNRLYLGPGLLLFIVLSTITLAIFKQTVNPDISWWIVLLPVWLPIAICIGAILMLSIMCAVFIPVREKEERRFQSYAPTQTANREEED